MNAKGKIALVAAVAGGGLLLLMSGSKKASAAEAPSLPELDEEDLELPEVEPALPEVPVQLPDLGAGRPVVPPIPGPPPIVDDEEDEELVVRSPGIPQPRPAPAPAPSLPRPQPPPPPVVDDEEDEDELVVRSPGIPQPRPPAPPPVFVPSPAPVPTRPRPAPAPSPVPEEQPTELADDTHRVLTVMLARESGKDWKRKEPLLKVWQQNRGLTADGAFGPGTATRMAEETGLLPIIRFWPKGSLKETGAVDEYHAALLEEAQEAEEPRRSQLFAAVEREKGQGFGRGQEAITPTIQI